MSWVTTDEVHRFLGLAEAFLVADPVANNVLLTETRFWQRLSDPAPGARFGWWAGGDGVGGAFVDLPDHAVLCSPMSPDAIGDLPGELADAERLGVAAPDAAAVATAWLAAYATEPHPVARLTVLRLEALRARPLPEGAPRVAAAGDLPLLRSWFGIFRQRHPDDASSVEFVIDQPLEDGAVVLWEVDGRPVAMSSRTPEVAGWVRMGLSFQSAAGTSYADAAFDAGCAEATRRGEQVLVLSGSPDRTAAYGSLGFVPVTDRVVLEVRAPQPSPAESLHRNLAFEHMFE